MPLKQQSAKIRILGVKILTGIEQGDGPGATVDHYDFGITGFNADEAPREVEETQLQSHRYSRGERFFKSTSNGFQIQLNAPDYVGHVG